MPIKKNRASLTPNTFFPLEKVLLTAFVIFLSFFSLFFLLSPDVFANFFGFNRNDLFMYRLLGAAGFSYSVVLVKMMYEQLSWNKIQYVIFSLTIISLGSLYACVRAFLRPQDAQYIIYIITAFSLILLFVSVKQLVKNKLVTHGKTDLSAFSTSLIALITLLLVGGAVIVVIPRIIFSIIGTTGTDAFIYRLAGVYLFGLASLGVLSTFYRRFENMQLVFLIYTLFFSLLFLISLIELIRTGELIRFSTLSILSFLLSVLLLIGYKREKK